LGAIFHFEENEHFANSSLKVHIKMKDEENPQEIVGTEINWKEGKDTTKKTVTKK